MSVFDDTRRAAQDFAENFFTGNVVCNIATGRGEGAFITDDDGNRREFPCYAARRRLPAHPKTDSVSRSVVGYVNVKLPLDAPEIEEGYRIVIVKGCPPELARLNLVVKDMDFGTQFQFCKNVYCEGE